MSYQGTKPLMWFGEEGGMNELGEVVVVTADSDNRRAVARALATREVA